MRKGTIFSLGALVGFGAAVGALGVAEASGKVTFTINEQENQNPDFVDDFDDDFEDDFEDGDNVSNGVAGEKPEAEEV